jgi:hypothetical protein
MKLQNKAKIRGTVALGRGHSLQPEGMSELFPFPFYLFTFCQNKPKYPHFQSNMQAWPKNKAKLWNVIHPESPLWTRGLFIWVIRPRRIP